MKTIELDLSLSMWMNHSSIMLSEKNNRKYTIYYIYSVQSFMSKMCTNFIKARL